MVRFSEIIKRTNSTVVKKIGDLGALSFSTVNSDKNKERTPHYEFQTVIKLYNEITLLASGINQLDEFTIPGKIGIFSKDKKTAEFLQEWVNQRPYFDDQVHAMNTSNMLTGNAYAETRYANVKGSDKQVLDNVFSVNDVGRIYVNPDDTDGKKKFIFELPVGVKRFTYSGEDVVPSFLNITYTKNYSWVKKRIWGFYIRADQLKHWKSGWSLDNIYGRSSLCSSVDTGNGMLNLISNWDTIVKTRALNHKILFVGDPEEGKFVDDEKLQEIEDSLGDSDKSYTLFNMPIKLVDQSIDSNGQYDTMEVVYDAYRRELMMSLLPNHLTPWADSATTMGAGEAMPAFLLKLKQQQMRIIEFINHLVIDDLRKEYPWLSDDATFTIPEPNIVSMEYTIRNFTDLFREGIINKEQVQRLLIGKGILPEDLFQDEDGNLQLGEESEQDDFNEGVSINHFR